MLLFCLVVFLRMCDWKASFNLKKVTELVSKTVVLFLATNCFFHRLDTGNRDLDIGNSFLRHIGILGLPGSDGLTETHIV